MTELPHNGIMKPRKDGRRHEGKENLLICRQQGRYGDCVDEIIFKVANAPIKKVKIEYV